MIFQKTAEINKTRGTVANRATVAIPLLHIRRFKPPRGVIWPILKCSGNKIDRFIVEDVK
jgi:hypothetical protein